MDVKTRAAEFGFLLLAIGVVSASVYSLVGSLDRNTASTSLVQERKEGQSRSPSSLTDPDYESIALRCVSGSRSIRTHASKLRITGPMCASSLSIENKSIPFTATVIEEKTEKTFSTDLIPLKTGRNELQISAPSLHIDLTVQGL